MVDQQNKEAGNPSKGMSGGQQLIKQIGLQFFNGRGGPMMVDQKRGWPIVKERKGGPWLIDNQRKGEGGNSQSTKQEG